MNSLAAWAGASTLILAGSAHAQTAPPGWYPPPYLAHVSVHAAPSTELTVVPAGGSAALAHCSEYCDFWAMPGRYSVYWLDPGAGEHKRLALRIEQSSRFQLEPGDPFARNTGLALGIAGPVAVLSGVLLLLASTCEGNDCGAERGAAGLFIAGAIATPIGWTMFAHNRPHLQRIDEGSATTTDGRGQMHVGVIGVGRGGLGLGAVAAF